MTTSNKLPTKVGFGRFNVDLDAGELHSNGHRIRLQVQPFQLLQAFLQRPNELITREELQHIIWPEGTFVDFDQGLNKAINKLRDALGDTADTPRYIETVPKRGYRFIAPVIVESTTPLYSVIPELQSDSEAISKTYTSKPVALIRWVVIGMACSVLLAALTAVLKHRVAAAQDLNSIAVLPLLAKSNIADDVFADGMTDSIIDDLATMHKLRVISYASVFPYKNKVSEPRAIGRELGVDAVLTGRVEKSETSLAVSVELTATSDGRHLWGRRYMGGTSDRDGLALEVANAVSEALRIGSRSKAKKPQ